MKTTTELKQELAGLVARKMELTRERVSYRKATAPSLERGNELWRMWRNCRRQKELIRYAALALAFVRGRPYWTVERRCHEQHRPWWMVIGRVAGADELSVKAWLAAKPTAEEAAAWQQHVEATREMERSAKEARRRARSAA